VLPGAVEARGEGHLRRTEAVLAVLDRHLSGTDTLVMVAYGPFTAELQYRCACRIESLPKFAEFVAGPAADRLRKFGEKLARLDAAGTRVFCFDDVAHPDRDILSDYGTYLGLRAEEWPALPGGFRFVQVTNEREAVPLYRMTRRTPDPKATP